LRVLRSPPGVYRGGEGSYHVEVDLRGADRGSLEARWRVSSGLPAQLWECGSMSVLDLF